MSQGKAGIGLGISPLSRYQSPHHRGRLSAPRTSLRRGAGVVDRGGLENRCSCKRTVGSNPTLSAIFLIKSMIYAKFDVNGPIVENLRQVELQTDCKPNPEIWVSMFSFRSG